MHNNTSCGNFEDAVITRIENGEKGLQPAIFITLKNSDEKYLITISNSYKFCIVKEKDEHSPLYQE